MYDEEKMSLSLCKLFFILWVLIAAGLPAAWATNTIKSRFLTAYPSAVGTRLATLNGVNHCGACHYAFSSSQADFGNMNPYGVAISNNGTSSASILAIGSQDSDGDGFSNDVEITGAGYCNVPTFPGLTPTNVSQVTALPSGSTAADLSGYLVPVLSFRVGLLDFAMFALHWLQIDCLSPDNCDGADFDGNGSVDINDLDYFGSYWMVDCPPNWPW